MLTRRTAVVIFTNAYDLCISIGKEKEDKGLFSIAIMRGPGDRYMPLLTSTPFAETAEKAILAIKEILELSRDCSLKEFVDPESLIAQIINPSLQLPDDELVLNTKLIERILEELKEKGVANTWEMLPIPT